MVGAFKWNTQINVSIDRNKAAKLGTNDTPIGGFNNQEDYNRTAVGKPLGMFYGYVYDGVFMTEAEYEAGPKHASSMVGTVRMKDLNGDNKIDMDDRDVYKRQIVFRADALSPIKLRDTGYQAA